MTAFDLTTARTASGCLPATSTLPTIRISRAKATALPSLRRNSTRWPAMIMPGDSASYERF
jgi:hypothetical protein